MLTGHEGLISQYLASLTKGPESYPDCAVTAILYRRLLHDEIHIKNILNAVPFFATQQLATIQDATFIPLTLHVAAVLAFAQARQLSCPQMKLQIKRYGKEILSGPIYRRLFALLSPSLVIMGAGYRYSRDFKGATATGSQLSKNSARMTLTNPANVFPRFYIESYNGLFEASLEAAAAVDATSRLNKFSDVGSETIFDWK